MATAKKKVAKVAPAAAPAKPAPAKPAIDTPPPPPMNKAEKKVLFEQIAKARAKHGAAEAALEKERAALSELLKVAFHRCGPGPFKYASEEFVVGKRNNTYFTKVFERRTVETVG